MANLKELIQKSDNLPQELAVISGLEVYSRSITTKDGILFFLAKQKGERFLGMLGSSLPKDFDLSTRRVEFHGQQLFLGIGQANHQNAEALRRALPFTAPVRVGLRKSAGLGDRLGIATPGHIRALRHAPGIFGVLAQQSIREMERTHRSPEQVIDSATWGVFQEGWREGFGADADHLKTKEDIDRCVTAGFIMYTLDPREHVDNQAETDSLDTLRQKFYSLPWERLHSTAEETMRTYAGKDWTLSPDCTLHMTEETLLRAACKYGQALAHLAELYQHLKTRLAGRPFELEISVDETDTPTKPEEHFFIASELGRLGVEWVSLAPRYIGRFEKGVDYIGDLTLFEKTFKRHVAVAKALGPYKLSLHSGSDKFSIYPLIARLAGELVHLKTAGTSYLEALHAIAQVDPALFREILTFAIANYEKDKVSYHVSAQLSRVPNPSDLNDQDLVQVLYQFDARQVLHVTFGTVLTAQDGSGHYLFRDRLFKVLEANEETHYNALETHLSKHLEPFSSAKSTEE